MTCYPANYPGTSTTRTLPVTQTERYVPVPMRARPPRAHQQLACTHLNLRHTSNTLREKARLPVPLGTQQCKLMSLRCVPIDRPAACPRGARHVATCAVSQPSQSPPTSKPMLRHAGEPATRPLPIMWLRWPSRPRISSHASQLTQRTRRPSPLRMRMLWQRQ